MGHNIKSPLLAALMHDGGHALTAIAVAFAGSLVAGYLGASQSFALFIGCALGGVLLPLGQEIHDYLKYSSPGKLNRDSIHDIATYQPVWGFYFAYTGQWAALAVVLALVVIVEAVYYWGMEF